MKFDKNMKIGITITTIVAVLFCYSLVGNNQLAQANQDTRGVSINLGVSDIMSIIDKLLGREVSLGGSTSDDWNIGGNLVVTGTSAFTGALNAAIGTFSGALTVTGTTTANSQLITNAGHLKSYTNSTSSPASMTLRVSDVLDYDTVLMSPTGAAAAKTFTFFASSTATDLVPTVGDMQDLCWHNATGTAATTNIFAAGTGMNLQTSSSTPTDLTIQAGNFMCMKFVREPDTDISVLMTEFEDAD